MKTKRTFIPVFTLSVALLLTACNGKEAADTKKTQTTQTESGTEAVTGSVAESGTETAVQQFPCTVFYLRGVVQGA